MKIAFVIQRYGSEVLGGSEQLCRLVAERLAARHDVDVLTTCARDYVTWKNEYQEGVDRQRGVTVRRFANARTRDLEAFNKYSDWIFQHPHSRADEIEWLKQQGPWCPALTEYLRRHHQQYDTLIFFTYLYATTVMGIEVSPGKSVLVSTAHDEPAIRLEIYKEVFGKAGALCYLTASEQTLVQRLFHDRPLLEEIVGVGVDLPQQTSYPRLPVGGDVDVPPAESADGSPAPSLAAAAVRGTDGDPANTDDAESSGVSQHLTERGAVFRRRHRLYGPLALYGGRIDPGKGCEELLDYFDAFIKRGGKGTLALMGAKLMSLPEEPYVRFAGLLSEVERLQALEAATVVVCPSPFESLSLLALEAMAAGTPVLVNARSAVLVEHCVRSNAGLWYESKDEFVEALNLLFSDAELRRALGRNGREYVRQHYQWDIVLGKYEGMLGKVRNAR
jgi:glycosyltransferase involved in cell wall biosynthesis